MKKIMIIMCTLAVLLGGCDTKNKEYVRDTTPGTLEKTTLEDIYEKFENKEDFVLLITFTFCAHCQRLKEVLEPYLENHHVVVYELVMDELVPTNKEYEEAKAKLNKYLKDYEGTPSFYYIEDGKKKEEIIGFDEGNSNAIDAYDEIVVKHQLDAVK